MGQPGPDRPACLARRRLAGAGVLAERVGRRRVRRPGRRLAADVECIRRLARRRRGTLCAADGPGRAAAVRRRVRGRDRRAPHRRRAERPGLLRLGRRRPDDRERRVPRAARRCSARSPASRPDSSSPRAARCSPQSPPRAACGSSQSGQGGRFGSAHRLTAGNAAPEAVAAGALPKGGGTVVFTDTKPRTARLRPDRDLRRLRLGQGRAAPRPDRSHPVRRAAPRRARGQRLVEGDHDRLDRGVVRSRTATTSPTSP